MSDFIINLKSDPSSLVGAMERGAAAVARVRIEAEKVALRREELEARLTAATDRESRRREAIATREAARLEREAERATTRREQYLMKRYNELLAADRREVAASERKRVELARLDARQVADQERQQARQLAALVAHERQMTAAAEREAVRRAAAQQRAAAQATVASGRAASAGARQWAFAARAGLGAVGIGGGLGRFGGGMMGMGGLGWGFAGGGGAGAAGSGAAAGEGGGFGISPWLVGGGIAAAAGIGLLRTANRLTAEAAEKQREWADEFIRYRDAQREAVAITGRPTTSRGTIQFGRYQAETGLGNQEALQFVREFRGTAAQFIGRRISETEATRLETMVPKVAELRGYDPGTIGGLAGAVLGTKDYTKETVLKGEKAADVALRDINETLRILEHGRGATSAMAQEATAVMTALVSDKEIMDVLHTSQNAAIMASVMAEYKPGSAEVYVRNAVNAVRETTDPKKKAFALGQAAGTAPGMDFFTAVEKLAVVVEKMATTEHVTIQDIMMRYFGNERGRVGLAQLIGKGVGPEGLIEERRAFGAAVSAGGGAPEEIARAERDPESALYQRKAKERLEQAKRVQGERIAPLQALLTGAEAELIGERQIDAGPGIADVLTDAVGSLFGFVGADLPKARERRIYERAGEKLRGAFGKAGIAFDESLLVEGGQRADFQEGYGTAVRELIAAGYNLEGERINPVGGPKAPGGLLTKGGLPALQPTRETGAAISDPQVVTLLGQILAAINAGRPPGPQAPPETGVAPPLPPPNQAGAGMGR